MINFLISFFLHIRLLSTLTLLIMKKLCFFIAFTAFWLTSFAQLEKGTWMLGRTASLRAFEEKLTLTFNTNTFNQQVFTNHLAFKIAPSLGYFIADKFNMGLRTAYESSRTNFIANRSISVHDLAIGPYTRYYVLNHDKLFNILIDAGYQLGYNWWVNVPDWPPSFYNPISSQTFTISAGPVVFLTENVALELSFGYIYQSGIRKDVSKNISTGFNTSVGFQFHY
ncbi:MAG: hypothetical protein EAZ51_07825 [Sphingobacteriales bacterium]|nr:MAG: hypothetical protein EAZ64_05545 [Sphingobacteriales bacterium]TAF79337.1 MAG: hypothetical protein EAZ51_07825 [Sphingobacteriales bacterium]